MKPTSAEIKREIEWLEVGMRRVVVPVYSAPMSAACRVRRNNEDEKTTEVVARNCNYGPDEYNSAMATLQWRAGTAGDNQRPSKRFEAIVKRFERYG